MRLVAALLALLILAIPASAQFGGRADVTPQGTTDEQLEYLFARLLAAADENEADNVGVQIQQLWLRSGSATTDLLMRWALIADDANQSILALDLLDGIIAIQPDFAEAWHRRAIIAYGTGDLSAAIADIERTLALEPRHFGALAGLGQIYHRIGEDELSLRALQAALAINPFMSGTRDLATEIENALGRNI